MAEVLLVIGGLYLLGKQMAKPLKYEDEPQEEEHYMAGGVSNQNEPVLPIANDNRARLMYDKLGMANSPLNQFGSSILYDQRSITLGTGITPVDRSIVPNMQVTAPDTTRPVYGTPTLDQRDLAASYITNVQRNVRPVAPTMVGKGLGVGPDVPAAGGLQQDYRILQENINEYKLTTLPGLPGTGAARYPQGPLPVNVPNVSSYVDGTGNIITIPKVTKEPNRVVDGIQVGPEQGAKYLMTPVSDYVYTSQPTIKDQTLHQGNYGFAKGQTSLAPTQRGMYYDPSGNRSQTTQMGQSYLAPPGGRGQITPVTSSMTSMPQEKTPVPFTNPMATRSQQYVPPSYIDQNPYKEQMNPYGTPEYMRITADINRQNPVAVRPYALN